MMTTRADLITRFPEFSKIDSAVATTLIEDLDVEFDSGSAYGDSATRAICLHAAHRLRLMEIGKSGAAGAVLSESKSESDTNTGKSKSVSVSYASPGTREDLERTEYGRQLIALRAARIDMLGVIGG
jgi:hypothetical protein